MKLKIQMTSLTPAYFLTHVEPSHPLRGQEALFFIREQSSVGNKTYVVEKQVPHFFFMPNMPSEVAAELLAKLQQGEELQHIIFTKHRYNSRKGFIRAEGSKEDRLILPDPFLCKSPAREFSDPMGLNSPARQLRWLYPPFMTLESAKPDSIPSARAILDRQQHHSFTSLESLLQDSYAAIDIEVKGWQQGNDQIYMVVYVSPNRKIILHDLPFEESKYDQFDLMRYDTQQELGKLLTEIIHEEDPLWIYGHNIMKYDQLQLRRLTGTYLPTANEHYPITKSTQGLGRVITKGRFTLDTFTHMFNYSNIFANNKLETLAGFDKSISYAEMDELEHRARAGDAGAFARLLHYTAEDGLRTEQTGKKYMRRVAQKALHFQRDVDCICTTGKYTLAKESWKRKHFFVKGTFEDGWKKHWKKEETANLDVLKGQFLDSAFRKGYFEDVYVIYLTPFIAGCSSLVKRICADELERFRASTEPLEKFDILQTINAQLGYLVEESIKILEREGQQLNTVEELTRQQEAAFYCLFTYHGLPNVEPMLFIRGIQHSFHLTQKAMNHHETINKGTYLHFLRGNLQTDKLERRLLGCYLGTGSALSIEQGRVIANPFGEVGLDRFVYQGFSPYKGRRCNFEKKVLQDVIRRTFAGARGAEVAADTAAEVRQFLLREAEQKEYVIPAKRTTYLRNLMEHVLKHSSVDKEARAAYANMKHRIKQDCSLETMKLLKDIGSKCAEDYSSPFIGEVFEEICEPYPPTIDLVFAENCPALVPASFGLPIDYERYERKVKATFEPLYEALAPPQLELGI